VRCVAGVGALALVSTVALSGCSGSPRGDGRAVPTSAAASTSAGPSLSAQLLSVNELPTGWAVDSSENTANACNSHPLEAAPPAQEDHVYFADAGGTPALQEALATYRSSAVSAFHAVKTALDKCTSFDSTANGETVHETQGAMSFPAVGDQSAAYEASFTIQGIAASFDIVIARRGSVLVAVAEGDVGSVDVDQFQGFVNQALAKVV